MKSALLSLLGLAALVAVSEAKTIKVKTTIQAAVNAAQAGDAIEVPPGTYRENVTVSKDNITIRGSTAAVMDGAGLAGSTGIRVVSATAGGQIRGFQLDGMTIRNYSRNGVLLLRVNGYDIRGGNYEDNEFYAIFPIFSPNGVIEQNDVSGSEDSGIYVGQSSDVTVSKNHVHDCRVGIEVENSSRIEVEGNKVSGNAIGLLVFVVPGLTVTATSDVQVVKNLFDRNNRPIVPEGPTDALLPSGVGMLNVGGDRVTATDNIAIGNNSAGIAVIRLPADLAAADPRVDPFADQNLIEGNVAQQNGGSPDPHLAPLPGADLLWDLTGAGNHWLNNVFKTAFPSPLP